MTTPVILPKLGNTVESAIIVRWHRQPGDPVRAGEVLCEVETDKSVMEVPAPIDGVLIAQHFREGDDVKVLSQIAEIGSQVSGIRYQASAGSEALIESGSPKVPEKTPIQQIPVVGKSVSAHSNGNPAISPRARELASREALDTGGIVGSGPDGRVIERDIQAALKDRPTLTPLAKSHSQASQDRVLPAQGSGIGGRVTAADLTAKASPDTPSPDMPDEVETIPLKGVRKLIADRMVASLHTSAQLTLHASADARALLDYRKRLKASAEPLGLREVSINDLVLFAVARTLPDFPDLNSTLSDGVISRYKAVHLGFAVDTPRGLLVPVIRNAHALSLRALSQEAKRLAESAQNGTIAPDSLSGGTFTVTNLGSLGIESFTPIINPPQVAILGVGAITLKPIELDGEISFIPHIGLSLTVDHQAVDGAPGARFIAGLIRNVAAFDLLLAR